MWQGYIFVNLDGLAPPLAAALSPIEPYIRNYHPAEQHFLYEAEEVWKTNWKCLVENFMEGYHLSPLHAKTLHPVTPTRSARNCPTAPHFTGYRANFHPDCPERGPFHPDLTLEGAAIGRVLLRLSEFRGRLLSALHPLHVLTAAHGRHGRGPLGHHRDRG